MPAIRRESLLSLEDYARQRARLRAEAIAHRRLRSVRLGEDIALQFEDEITVRYQIQEMLRIERIFEEDGIRAELDAYNPLVPDGSNLKATMMLEFPDPQVRRERLARLIGIEDRVWLRVADSAPAWAIADEDMERENAEKTSSVHFLRFELTPAMKDAIKAGAALSLGVSHPAYSAAVDPVPEALRAALAGDLA